MPVTVHFRGSMLFCSKKDGTLDRILLPDCRITPPEGTGTVTGMEHLDGRRAILHYHGIHEPSAAIKHRDFRNENVTIRGGTTADKPVANLSILPVLPKHIFKLDLGHPHSTVELFGNPTITTRYSAGSSRIFSFLDQPLVHDQVLATFPDDVTIQIGNDTSFSVPNGDVYLYNFDVEHPTVTELTYGSTTDQEILVDDDFKWVYALVSPRAKKSRKKATGRFLPSPVSVARDGDTLFTIFVSTCFPAMIED